MLVLFSTPFRSWRRRMLKTAGFLLLLVVAVLSIAINRFDEPLERVTQAWLDYPMPAPTAPDAPDGYLALWALDATVEHPMAAARTSHQATVSRYLDVQAQLLNPTHESLRALENCRDDCDAYLLAHREIQEAQSIVHAGLIRRCRDMLLLPTYTEDLPLDGMVLLPNYTLARKLDLLRLGQVVFALEEDDAHATYQDWAQHQRFWQMAASGSIRLANVLMAGAELERSQVLLSQLLAAHPDSMAIARRHVLPVLEGRPRLVSLIVRSMVYEFRLQAYLLIDQIFHVSLVALLGNAQPAGTGDWLALPFYQPHASLNLLHRAHHYEISERGVTLEGAIMPDAADAPT